MALFIDALGQIFSNPIIPLLIIGGSAVGIMFGCIPGLSAGICIALFLPITFKMEITTSFALLLAIYIGGISGGLISAILINIPGTAASIATCFDGHPMVKKGEAWKALSVGIIFSFVGTIIGVLVLTFAAPALGSVALSFSVFEYFSIALFSLTLVSALCDESIVKGLLACLLGMFFACVGAAPIDGYARYTFGFHQLAGGFQEVPVCVGLFAISELLINTSKKKKSGKLATFEKKGFGITKKEFVGQLPNALRSGLIGVFIGILPGIGASVCNLLAYGAAKKSSKTPEKFGTGIIDGLVASESSNNACIGGTMVPLLTLGIPGDVVTAILLGAFVVNGLTPGPLFYSQNIELMYVIFALLFIGAIVTFVIQFFGIRGFIQVLRIPQNILLPMVLVMCVIGSFATNNRMFDVWTLLFWGLLGYGMIKLKFPLTPMIMGYILGPLCEKYLRRGLMMSRNDFMEFFRRRVSGVFLVLAIGMIVFTLIVQLRKTYKEKSAK